MKRQGIRCAVIGAGGHARVVIDAMRREGRYTPVAAIDRDKRKIGMTVSGVPVVGDEALGSLKGVRYFVVAVSLVTANAKRRDLFEAAIRAGLKPATIRHPSSVIGADVELNAGSVVMAGVIINCGARVGQNVILNTGCIVEHDCEAADHVHVGPGAVLCGGVRLSEGVFIGAGAVVRETVKVGAWSVVGAGSVVLNSLAEKSRVAGVPARPIT